MGRFCGFDDAVDCQASLIAKTNFSEFVFSIGVVCGKSEVVEILV